MCENLGKKPDEEDSKEECTSLLKNFEGISKQDKKNDSKNEVDNSVSFQEPGKYVTKDEDCFSTMINGSF